MWKSLKRALFVGYMLIDTFKLGEKGDMDDAIRQARAKLRFGPAAVDGQSAARLGARTSGGVPPARPAGGSGKGGRSFRIGSQFGIPSNARPASGRPHAAVGNMASICNLSGTRRNWSRGPTRSAAFQRG